MSAVLASGNTQASPAHHEDTVRKAAVAWYVRLCSGDATPSDHAAWRRWHDEHPDHQRAWARIESIRSATQRVPAAIAGPTLAAAGKGRRQVLRSLALLASGGVLSYAGYRGVGSPLGAAPWASLLADFRTGTGEMRELALADGSQMILNTGTAVDVAFDGAQRLIRLHAGEVLIQTASHLAQARSAAQGVAVAASPPDARPFLVQSAHGTVRALGTRFIVREADAQTQVTVLQDSVEIRPIDSEVAPVLLRAGQQLSFTRNLATAGRAADPAADAWTRGSLVVDDWRLGDVLTELARYHAGRLAFDSAVADIRVSGAFPVHDTDRALTAIMQSFPVRVQSLTRYWIRVVPA